MKNIELLPSSEDIQKDVWRDSILLNGRTGIELDYIGNIEGVHHFKVEYSEGYRGYYFTDEEIKEKAQDVISILPDVRNVNFGIFRR